MRFGILLVTVALAAQERSDALLERLRDAAGHVQDAPKLQNKKSVREMHVAYRNWIESLLPRNLSELNARSRGLQRRINKAIKESGLKNTEEDFLKYEWGHLDSVEITRPAQLPQVLVVSATITAWCATDATTYVYFFDAQGRKRIVNQLGFYDITALSTMRISSEAEDGSRYLFLLRQGSNCTSRFTGIYYTLYRVKDGTASLILKDERGAVRGDTEEIADVRLTASDLLVLFTDSTLDSDIIDRRAVVHYRISGNRAARVDPFALRPGDFVDEWIQRPWKEVSLVSAKKPNLETWHQRLSKKLGVYGKAHRCQDSSLWQIGFDPERMSRANEPEGPRLYFLVREKSRYSYELEDVSTIRQPGCQTPPRR